MTPLTALSTDYEQARQNLQLVATHILARARFLSTGRFGLRVTWDGFGTPAFGPHSEVLRLSGVLLVRERQDDHGARTSTLSVAGRSLEELATFAEIDLTTPFSAGNDAPAMGDPSTPVDIPSDSADAVLAWFRVGAVTFDRILTRLVEPSIMQLWPEHFDVGFDAATTAGRVNLGASPGDATQPEPYLYIGPWDADRPGDSGYWNAPFGAMLTYSELRAAADPVEASVSFLQKGLDILG
jgi:hypothetical protein